MVQTTNQSCCWFWRYLERHLEVRFENLNSHPPAGKHATYHETGEAIGSWQPVAPGRWGASWFKGGFETPKMFGSWRCYVHNKFYLIIIIIYKVHLRWFQGYFLGMDKKDWKGYDIELVLVVARSWDMTHLGPEPFWNTWLTIQAVASG